MLYSHWEVSNFSCRVGLAAAGGGLRGGAGKLRPAPSLDSALLRRIHINTVGAAPSDSDGVAICLTSPSLGTSVLGDIYVMSRVVRVCHEQGALPLLVICFPKTHPLRSEGSKPHAERPGRAVDALTIALL